MSKKEKKIGIKKTQSDGVTIFEIFGLDNDIRAYQQVLKGLKEELNKNRMKIIAAGKPMPVIRTLNSVELH